jgi:hypothetical protein
MNVFMNDQQSNYEAVLDTVNNNEFLAEWDIEHQEQVELRERYLTITPCSYCHYSLLHCRCEPF